MNGDSKAPETLLRCVAACPPERRAVKPPSVVVEPPSADRPIMIQPGCGAPAFCCAARADGSVELMSLDSDSKAN